MSPGVVGRPALQAHGKDPQQPVCLPAWCSAAASPSSTASSATSTSRPRRLGFADLRACLHALLDDGWSIPRLTSHLATTQPAIRRTITHLQVHQPPRRQQLARQRQHAAHQRVADRLAELGFENARAYLVDRLITNAWTLTRIQDELGAAPATLRRLLDQHQVRRVAPTRRSGPWPGEALDLRRRHGPRGSSARRALGSWALPGSRGTCGTAM
jgi:hypothetical protein